jgi:hypothetical protein
MLIASFRFRYAVFWDVTELIVVIPYRSFGTNCRSHLQGSRNNFVTLEGGTDSLSRNVGKK